jgi:hypothetical protein
VKKPLLQKKWFSELLIRGFQSFSSQNAIIFGNDQILVNWPIKPWSSRTIALFLEVEGGRTNLGISSSF